MRAKGPILIGARPLLIGLIMGQSPIRKGNERNLLYFLTRSQEEAGCSYYLPAAEVMPAAGTPCGAKPLGLVTHQIKDLLI